MVSEQVKILLIDDDDVDAMVIRRALKRNDIRNEVIVAHDGIEAFDLLRGDHGCRPISGPVMILLDLNMPRMGGLQFLSELRQDRDLRTSIVFVLTTSDDQRDRDAAYDMQVAGYLVKSRAGQELQSQISLVENYLESVRFPVCAASYISNSSLAGDAQ
ncbi:response regulator [Planctomycetes bacterium K23_9]|uniref:Response regulator rcp1 n=1 Tax=Stieleria marina TaxID=1930275 RepID=A0A517NY96_9BACT|nr:Response regulator rcp1 [Planctomycetes bacterium K23_9]